MYITARALAQKGLIHHDFGVDVCTLKLLGPFGASLRKAHAHEGAIEASQTVSTVQHFHI